MKTVLILRHAKSDWNAAFGSDHERPLNARGQAAAKRMGRYLAQIDQVPDHVVTSSAVRARTTVELAAAAGGWSCDVEVTDELYEAWPESVLERIQRADDGRGSLLLAGHEPTWSALASRLIGGARLRFPTAALVRIDFDADRWTDVSFQAGTLVWFVTPKLLASFDG